MWNCHFKLFQLYCSVLRNSRCWPVQEWTVQSLDLYLAWSSCDKHMFLTISKTMNHDPTASRDWDTHEIQHLNLTTIILTRIMEVKGPPALTGLNWLTMILFNKPPKLQLESLKIYTGTEHWGENLHWMYVLKTLMLPSLYLDSFAAGSLLIFAHKCPGVIKSQMKYFLCHQYLSACCFHSQGTIPSGPDSLSKPGIYGRLGKTM